MAFTIAVDGPAASGKGTLAGRLAATYDLPYLDTGLLYRCVGVKAGPAATEARGVEVAETLRAEDLADPQLRTRSAGELASQIAVFAGVRAALLDFQTRFADRPSGAVVDGRDIGTVIAPRAPCKLFVTARPEVRAERRWKQLAAQGEVVSLSDILADIGLRDARDSGRDAAPLARAPDAVLLDTSDLTISQSVEAARRIVEAARSRWEISRSG